MEIIARKGQLQIIINTDDNDFDRLMDSIDNLPKEFRSYLETNLGIKRTSFYMKRRDKTFKLLEKQKLSELTGIDL